MSVCVCVWAMLPDSNKMMTTMMIEKHETSVYATELRAASIAMVFHLIPQQFYF